MTSEAYLAYDQLGLERVLERLVRAGPGWDRVQFIETISEHLEIRDALERTCLGIVLRACLSLSASLETHVDARSEWSPVSPRTRQNGCTDTR